MYQIILLPLIAAIIAQITKFFISSNRLKINLRSLISYSGMPSSHAALTISLTTIIALTEGMASPVFALALILTIIVIRDAVGLRKYLEQNSRVLNELVKELKSDHLLEEKYPRLLEHIGHTPAQILAGGLIGLLISLIGYWL